MIVPERGVPVHDLGTFASVILLVTAVALCSIAIPAKRAAQIEPAMALRRS